MDTIVERPTLQDQQVARESLPVLTEAIAQRKSERIRIQIQAGSAQGNNMSVTVPTKALHLLAFILENMAQGKPVSLIPSDSELSTQQAADMLNVSRPHVVKLLEEGLIPFKKAGTHRRILLEDLLHYEAQQKNSRKERLQFLAEQAQDLNLGYE